MTKCASDAHMAQWPYTLLEISEILLELKRPHTIEKSEPDKCATSDETLLSIADYALSRNNIKIPRINYV